MVLAGAVAVRAEWPADPSSNVSAPLSHADDLAKQAYQILKANCFECHGATKRSGLDMRTHATLTSGGSKGRVIIPHEPDKSLLYRFASYEHEIKMPPPPRDRISESDLDILRQWIEAGGSLESVDEANNAAKSAEALLKSEERPIKPAEREYWAFKPLARMAMPLPKTSGWNVSPLDAFLASAMEAKGLKPSAPADRRTLIRRAYLDVLGLPPTPEQVDAFVADRTPGAWTKVVDEVLASPHYGERWARHWMDLVRYADSEGFEFDVDRTQMYRYRDYLINAFNTDKPYDQFIKEQLAGDEYARSSS